MKNLILIALFGAVISHHIAAQGTWQTVSSFGTNPGNLTCYEYIPQDMPANAPLVVVLHGCTQNATGFANETGWNTLADIHKFYVVYAEQKSANNSSNCFNYWEPDDHSRGKGEAKSINQMQNYMQTTYSIDANKVFVTGLSAGGAMTNVMLSAYPQNFKAGAEMAGLPYKVATSYTGVLTAAPGLVSKPPSDWGDLVRVENPNFSGTYPRLAIFHGTSDIVINDNNATESMKQFTNLHGADQTADYTDATFNNNARVELRQYENSNGDVVVEWYIIDNMAHGIAVDPGTCGDKGGQTATNSIDVNFYSSYWAAKFFGILQDFPNYTISGPDTVLKQATGITYSVPNTSGSSYQWTVPNGVSITSGQGTNAIETSWSNTSGMISVSETTAMGCDYDAVEFMVTAVDSQLSTGIQNIDELPTQLVVYQNGSQLQYTFLSPINEQVPLHLYNMNGQLILSKEIVSNQTYTLPQNLPGGVYLLKGITRQGELTGKVVVH